MSIAGRYSDSGFDLVFRLPTVSAVAVSKTGKTCTPLQRRNRTGLSPVSLLLFQFYKNLQRQLFLKL